MVDRRVLALLIAGWIPMACGSKSSPISPTPRAMTAVLPHTYVGIRGNASLRTVGDTSQLTATVVFSDGTSNEVTNDAQWASDDSSIATISSGGLLTAMQPGQTLIRAHYRDVFGVLSVTVAAASTFHLTGIAADDDGAPVPSATVTVHHHDAYPVTDSSISAVTDGKGAYSLDFTATYTAPNAPSAYLIAESPGHERFYHYLSLVPASQNISKNLHLYRIKRITAGESTLVTVVPGDTLCGDDGEFACRTVHIVVPADGLMTMACPNPNLMVGWNYVPWFVTGGLEIRVTAGREVSVELGMGFQSTVSQSCVFTTSLAP